MSKSSSTCAQPKLTLRSLAAGMTEPMSARDSFKGRHFDTALLAQTGQVLGSVSDRCKRLLRIHLTFNVPMCAVIGMNSPLPFAPVAPRLWAWLAVTHLVIPSFVNGGSPTTLSSPVYGRICALSLVTGIWPSWPGNLASRSAIPGAWTRPTSK